MIEKFFDAIGGILFAGVSLLILAHFYGAIKRASVEQVQIGLSPIDKFTEALTGFTPDWAKDDYQDEGPIKPVILDKTVGR